MEGSSVLTASALAPDKDAADSAEASMAKEMGDKEAASALLGVEVTSDPVFGVTQATPTLNPPIWLPIVIGVVAIVLGALTCFLAKRSGKKRRGLWGADYASCCSTGCCSGYGLKGWSQGTILAAIFLLGSAIPIYLQMNAVAVTLGCIITSVLELQDLGGDAASLLGSLAGVTGILSTITAYLNLLGVAAIVPAALAAVGMIVSAGCAYRTSSSMCCAKFFALLDHLLLILSAVLYIIFAALGVAITLPFVAEYLKIITAICETKIPILAELAQGASSALTMAEAAGTSADELADIKEAAGTLIDTYTLFDGACTCLVQLMFDLSGLVVPGAVAAIASFYGLYSIHGLCCAANCCYAPVGAGKPDGSGATIEKAVQDV
jgi:hypothetical protein